MRNIIILVDIRWAENAAIIEERRDLSRNLVGKSALKDIGKDGVGTEKLRTW